MARPTLPNRGGQNWDTQLNAAVYDVSDRADSAQSSINTHVGDTDNPHGVTKAQVGLGSVDNTADADKPISSAVDAALELKADASALDDKQDTASLEADVSSKVGTGGVLDTALNGAFVQYVGPTGDTTGVEDTTKIQDAINAGPSGSSVILTGGVYYIGNVQITNKVKFKLAGEGYPTLNLIGDAAALGTNGVGIEIVGSVSKLQISGLHIVGDGTKAHIQKGIWSNSGQTMSDLIIRDNIIEQVVAGISVNANMSGSIDGFLVADNVIKDLVGVGSGEGYGIHVAYYNTGSARGVIARNRIYRAGRHSIYCARAAHVDIIDNQIYGHRSAITTAEYADATDGRGKTRPAILVARSKHIRVMGNTLIGGFDGALVINPNPNAEAGVTLFDVAVISNHFREPQDAIPMLMIADSESPDIAGSPQDISIIGNAFWADFSVLDATRVPVEQQVTVTSAQKVGSAPAIQHNASLNGKIKGNSITIRGVNRSTPGIDFRAIKDESGTATYTNDFEVSENTIHAATVNASTCRGVRLDSSLASATARGTFRGNDATGDASTQACVWTSPYTNPNVLLRQRSGAAIGLYTPGDTTPTVGRGVSYMVIANTSATSITTLDDGEPGQVVILRFNDLLTTLVNATSGDGFRLNLATNLASGTRDTIMLATDDGSVWYEVAPKSDN